MPYWADLWPAARMLAKAIVRERWPAGLHALEIGCGLGLPGIAALAMGLHASPSATTTPPPCASPPTTPASTADELRHAANGLALSAGRPAVAGDPGLRPDLRDAQRGAAGGPDQEGAAPGGVCLLTDQDRIPSHVLRETLTAEGLPFTTQMLRAGEPGGRRLKGTLYRITQPGGVDPLKAAVQRRAAPSRLPGVVHRITGSDVHASLDPPPDNALQRLAGISCRQEATSCESSGSAVLSLLSDRFARCSAGGEDDIAPDQLC